MRAAQKLSIFNPPLTGDVISFPNGEQFEVNQDSYGWVLYYPNTFKKREGFPVVGFDMSAFLRAIFENCETA